MVLLLNMSNASPVEPYQTTIFLLSNPKDFGTVDATEYTRLKNLTPQQVQDSLGKSKGFVEVMTNRCIYPCDWWLLH